MHVSVLRSGLLLLIDVLLARNAPPAEAVRPAALIARTALERNNELHAPSETSPFGRVEPAIPLKWTGSQVPPASRTKNPCVSIRARFSLGRLRNPSEFFMTLVASACTTCRRRSQTRKCLHVDSICVLLRGVMPCAHAVRPRHLVEFPAPSCRRRNPYRSVWIRERRVVHGVP